MASIMYYLVSVLVLTSQLYAMEAKLTEASPRRSLLTTQAKPEVHIVYMGGISEKTTSNDKIVHLGMLSEALGSMQAASDSHLYSYTKSFNGFAAVFSESHAELIRGMVGVASVFKQQIKHTTTTASWGEYLGLSPTQGIWAQTDFGNGTIIGMVDTGIWPESMSFNDDGFGPVPSKWKGSCEKGQQFGPANCNKKLIGGKYFSKGVGVIPSNEYDSARDANGHGTHTSSTAGGNQVANASINGVANGTATGGAPSARVAMYKACWHGSCADADLLAAIEEAISDGVDLLSMSIAAMVPEDYLVDAIAIGSFHAVEKGIIVSCAAGNMGPNPGTAKNTAPWIFTVAASSINRVYESDVQLIGAAKNSVVKGAAINTNDMNSAYPIVSGADLGDATCSSLSDPTMVKGKIVVCSGEGRVPFQELVFKFGAQGWVYITDADADLSVLFYENNCSNSNVHPAGGDEILAFVNSTKNPTATIDKTVAVLNTVPAPIIADFSSVGPSPITADMLKPDISAPGVDILAAWAPNAFADAVGDYPFPQWNIDSGTSMATPHVAGCVALVKSAHPDWTPAAIKSAIMTTATQFNTSIPGNYELASGSGQINPNKAADPGLVFNMTTTDYVNFLCAIGYNNSAVDLMTGGKETCPPNPTTVLDMNYPSIYLSSNVTAGLVRTINRTVTSVGPSSGKYSVTVVAPEDVEVTVTPTSLEFDAVNQELSFTVTVTVKKDFPTYNFGSITWSDGTHSVRMPVGVGQTGLGPPPL